MTVLSLLFVLAAAVWLLPIVRSVAIPPLIGMVLLTGTVLGPAFFAIEAGIQLSLDRLLLFGVVVIFGARLVRGELRFPPPSRLDVALMGLVTVAFVSAARFGLLQDGGGPASRWLFFMALPLAVYVMTRVSRPTARQIDGLLTGLIALGVYLSVTATFEMTGLRALVFPKFINDPQVWEFYGRGRGPLLNPTGNGIVIAAALSACVSRFLRTDPRGKVGYACVMLVCLAGSYATLTRSVWLGTVATLAVVSVTHVPRWFRVLSLLCGVLLAGALALGLKDDLMRFKRDENLSAAEAAKSVQLRPLLAVVAWEMFCDRPLAGHGYGHYLTAAEPYHSIRYDGVPLETARPYMQHNVLLSILVDTGLIGLTLMLAFYGSVAALAWRLTRRPDDQPERRAVGHVTLGLLAAYFVNGMFQGVAVIEMVNMYVLFASGLTVTLTYRHPAAVVSRRATSVAGIDRRARA